jgi:hypothetical protein
VVLYSSELPMDVLGRPACQRRQEGLLVQVGDAFCVPEPTLS